MKTIRWGIIGTGYIAGLFAEGLQSTPDATLAAVASRSRDRANTFAERWGAKKCYGSYEEIAADPDVDVVYIATPHPVHYENTMMCLQAGKHSLVEKSFALNERQAQEMVSLARRNKLFLMEAMWTRYIPAFVQARTWIEEGAIGEVQLIHADLSIVKQYEEAHRLFAPELGGGALLDLGVYPVSLASHFMGEPKSISATATLAPTGVDRSFSSMFTYGEGKSALISGSTYRSVPAEAMIVGSKGHIVLPQPWFTPRSVSLYQTVDPKADVDLLTFIAEGNIHHVTTQRFPVVGNAYNYEAVEVGNRIRNGELESPIMPLDESVAIMRTMDEIRKQCGIRYPME